MILGRILSNSSFKSSPFATASLYYLSFIPPRFGSNNIGHCIRCFSVEPRFDVRRIREPDDAIVLFQEMLRMWPRPAVIDFTQLVSVVVDMKQYSLALQLLNETLLRDDSVKRSTPSIVMALFLKMVRMRPNPSVVDYNKFLSVLVKIKQYSLAIHLFEEMLRMDVCVSRCTLNIAINCFCQLKRPDPGFAILGSFFKRGCEPDVVTFTTLVKGLMLVGEILELEKLLVKMMTEHFCHLDVVTNITLINYFCKTGHTLQAFDFLMLLEKQSCKLNVCAYNIVINGLCKDRMVDGAFRLFSSLADKGISPDVVTYNSMIQGLCGLGRWDEVENLIKKMVASKVHPNVVTFNIMVDFLCKEGRVEEAEHTLKIMWQVGVQPNIITFNTLMNGHCRKGQVDEVLRLFTVIPSKGLELNLVSCNIMLHSLFCARRCEEGLKLFAQMQARLPCDVIAYSTLINGLCSLHRLGEAFSVLRMMEDEGIIPNIVTYTILIDGFCKGKRLDMAKHLFDKLPSIGLQPNVLTYTTLIDALCKKGQTEKEEELLVQMRSKGCSPNSVTYNVLVRGLVKRNRMHKVIPILEEMERRGFKVDTTTTTRYMPTLKLNINSH